MFNHELHERQRAGTGEVARGSREGTRKAETGIGGLAHGTHGIHGKIEAGDRKSGRNQGREKENDYENEERFFGGRAGARLARKWQVGSR